MNMIPLGELATVELSNIDKKRKDGEQEVIMCNFVDVYHNWQITQDMTDDFLVATASDTQIAKFTLKKGQVAITKDSETRDDIGMATYIADDIPNAVLGYHCALITPNDENVLDGEYLNLIMQSSYALKYFGKNASGSGMRYTLTKEIIEGFPVPMVDIDVQKKLSHILTQIDDKINLNNSICADLEAMAKQIYDYWFVQFDFPDENGRPYKSSGGAMVYNEELKREIPAIWGATTLGELATFKNGINYDKNEVGDKIYRIANVRNISASTLLMDEGDFDEINLVSKSADKYLLKDTSIVIARSGTPGATRLVLNVSDNVIYCGFIICCTPNDEHMRYYLTMTVKQYEGTSATKEENTILSNVSQDTLSSLKVVKPEEIIVKKFNETLFPLLTKMQECIEENRELAELRDFLLPMLMNGQIKVGA